MDIFQKIHPIRCFKRNIASMNEQTNEQTNK